MTVFTVLFVASKFTQNGKVSLKVILVFYSYCWFIDYFCLILEGDELRPVKEDFMLRMGKDSLIEACVLVGNELFRYRSAVIGNLKVVFNLEEKQNCLICKNEIGKNIDVEKCQFQISKLVFSELWSFLVKPEEKLRPILEMRKCEGDYFVHRICDDVMTRELKGAFTQNRVNSQTGN